MFHRWGTGALFGWNIFVTLSIIKMLRIRASRTDLNIPQTQSLSNFLTDNSKSVPLLKDVFVPLFCFTTCVCLCLCVCGFIRGVCISLFVQNVYYNITLPPSRNYYGKWIPFRIFNVQNVFAPFWNGVALKRKTLLTTWANSFVLV